MSALAVSAIIFLSTLGGIFLGALLRRTLPKHHLNEHAKDVVRLGAGLIATIAALVLGLLIAAAKGSFDTQSTHLKHITADLILLDNILAQYGPEARPIREEMRSTVGPFADRLWREKEAVTSGPFETDGAAERVDLEIQKLSPHDAVQRSLQARAVQISNDLAQVRFLLFAESENFIPSPFLAVLAFLAPDYIRKLQPVLTSQRDGLRLPFAVCFVVGGRNFPDFGTEPAVYRTAAVIQRATTKRPRNDMRSMEPSMTNNPDALLPSAKEVMQKIALAEAEEAEKQARMRAEAQVEKKALIDQLSKPSGISDEEAIGRGIKIIERAMHGRMTEVEVFRFPNQLCTDKGRAIIQQEPGWEKTLTGAPKEIYQLWEKYFRPRGYKLKVQIVDYPDGMPGDIGMTLSWV